jgi:hypothetical protein
MPSLDELCPPYVGDKRISLQLAPWAPAPIALAPVVVLVDYSAARPNAIALPLVFTVAAPSSPTLLRRLVRRMAPSAISFTPREGGRHLVRLGELAHNQWWGSLLILVAGDAPPPL